MKLTKKLETEILKVYYAYWDAYLKGDMKTFASFLDDNVTVYGTAAGEVFTNKKEAVKFYTMTADQMTGKADFRKRRIKMKTAGNTIVVNEECDLYVLIDGVWTFYDHARITAIIEQKGNAWKCVHQHGSFPDTRTEEGDQIATEKIKKENRQLKDAVKRRTIELEQKNRELETETALEKVRSVAMGMKERADMLKICKTISQQLAQLGVKEIRNVQTAIFNVPAGTYMNYEYYAKHNKTFITETTYTNHKVARAFAAKMLKGKGQVSITYIKGREKVKEWLNYQKGTNVFIDTYLNTATSLTYYWYSLGPVALGISTYTPLTKDEQLLFSRFLKVFELAYRRYLDIEKAEAQARKAQIEAALERVRAASLSMRDSSALSEIIFKLYGELTKLDAKLDRCFIMIVNPENKGITWWMAGQEGLLAQNGFFVQMNQHVSHLMYLDHCKQRKKKWTYLFEGKEKRDWDRFGFSKTELARLPEPVKAFMSAAKKVFLSGSSDQFGSLVTGSFEPLPEEQQEIISRFTIVFNQAYIRFLDLQKAEAQTREAEIQLALERVRARSLAMHHTSELQEVVNIAAQQLHGIGMDINGGVFIAINTEIDKELSIWASGGMADYIQKVIVPELNKPIFTTLRDAIRNGNSFLIETFSDKEKRELFTHLFKYEPWKSLPKERKEELLSRKGGFARSVVISQYTSISITNHHGKAFNEEENEILKRFGKVFEQSYIRFLDLQKAEAQAREAQIEAALERVRAAAMSMHRSEELLNVCEVLYKEVGALGFNTLRNAMINIHNDEKKSFINYDYSDEIGRSTNHLYYNIHPLVEKQIGTIRSADDAFSETYFTGRDLTTWKNFRKRIGEKNDPRLDRNKGLYYYFYSIGIGSIGISTFGPISEEKKALLKRFRNVFALSYQRYIDIAKAEVQAREAQIELALERVRARTMAMQHSDELSETVTVMFEQFKALGEEPERMAIEIVNEKEQVFDIWATQHGGSQLNLLVQISLDEPHVMQKMYRAWKAKTRSITIDLQGNELEEYFQFLKKAELPVQRKIFGKRRVQNVATFSKGILTIITPEPRPQETIQLLERFAAVFDHTYTRFLDLQKAEAQAREAQIETALERVRSRSLAMHHSSELSAVVDTLLREFTNLEFTLTFCIINLIDEQDRSNTVWAANPETGKDPESYYMKFEDYPFHHAMWDAWKEQKKHFIYTIEGEEKKIYDEYLYTRTEFRRFPKHVQEANKALKRYVAGFTFFKYSGLQTVSENHISEDELDILERFGRVFEQSYTRFLDLQKAEAQAREAKIEAALERTRTQSMIMQHSKELDDTLRVFHEQVLLLGIKSAFSFLWLPDEDKDRHIFWAAWAENDSAGFKSKAIDYPLDRNEPATVQCLVDWKAVEPVVSYHVPPAGVESYFAAWQELIAGVEKLKPEYFSGGLYYIEAFMKYGCFGVMVENELPQEEKKILSRFAIEFERTYTRFLDLQKAEAQAKEAQIETALERVRARTMAMQRSDELPDAATILFQQVQSLGMPAWSAGYCIWNEDKSAVTLWMSSEGVLQPSFTAPTTEDELFIEMRKGQEGGKAFHVVGMGGKKLVKHYEYMRTLPVVGEILDSIVNAGHPLPTFQIMHHAYFSKGFLLFITYEPVPDAHDIFQRFGKVFDQTYTRFLDLQKAEAQAREAQIETALEKVRSRTMAMHKSEELRDVIEVVYKQLVDLRLPVEHAGFILDYKKEDDMHIWFASKQVSPTEIKIPYFDSPHWNSFQEAKAHGKSFFANKLNFEEKNKFYKDLFKWIPPLPDEAVQSIFSRPGLIISTVLLENVGLYIENYSQTPFTEEENTLLMRFGKVFQQTYTRFLDLQKAEAQAKEAQIEAALEKVRSRTMAMQSSNELQETAAVLFNEFKKLGAEDIYQVTIGIYNEEEGLIDFRVTSWAGSGVQENRSFKLDMNEPTVLKPSVQAWKANKKSLIIDLSGEALEGWLNYRNKMSGITVSSSDTAGRRVITVAYYSKGHLSISTPVPVPTETLRTLERFAAVFDATYTRFLDLQKAEAQAREAKIEAALERVRSRTLAMQKSDELAETAAEVFRQLISLGIEPNRLYIGIVKDETGDMEMWATDEDGTHVGKKFMFNKNENASVLKLYDGWKTQKKSVIVDMQGKELEDYLHYLNNVMHIPFKGGLTQKRRVQSVAYFSKGFIGMASPDGQGDETIQLLERFAAVFNLTFTRFNDLKIAEAHAEQAEQDLIAIKEAKQKAEETLTELQATQKQLIQSEKMASLGELTAGIAHEIQNPLNFVNNFSEVSKELLDEMREAIEKGDTEEAKEIMNDVIQNLEKINHHGKRADGIVKGMLQHSRSSSNQKEPTDINALADEYLRLAYHGLRAKDKTFNATMKTDFDESIGNINIIPQDIGRVILNLITNAFYVVNEKSKQNIAGYEPIVEVITKKDGNKVLISVKDNGNGIPQKVLDKIFQPFFTTKPTGQGPGLGLSLSYDIIKAHGGELKVETKEGVGSEFIIILPV